jgi:hypothetical protein
VNVDPIHRGQLHVDPDTKISCRPVVGHAVSIMTFGRFFDLFATPADLARIADAITTYLNPAPAHDLTVDIEVRELSRDRDEAEAERFRVECERDLKGEDE